MWRVEERYAHSMNFDMLKHPAVGAIVSILTAVIVALAAAAGFGAFTPAEKNYTAGVPASATKASPEEVDKIIASRWTTDNAPKGTVITFDAGADGVFFVDGSSCNGFGAALKINRTKATYSVQDMPVTKMGCEPALQNFDAAMNRALKHGDTFYIDGDNAYLAKKGTGLKLTPAR